MVRATIIVSALFALVASVSAVPHGSWGLADVTAQKYIGTGGINLRGALKHAVSVDDLKVHDAVQDVRVASGGHGILRSLLKREEAAAPVRIARKAGVKGNKKMARKAAKNAQKA